MRRVSRHPDLAMWVFTTNVSCSLSLGAEAGRGTGVSRQSACVPSSTTHTAGGVENGVIHSFVHSGESTGLHLSKCRILRSQFLFKGEFPKPGGRCDSLIEK